MIRLLAAEIESHAETAKRLSSYIESQEASSEQRLRSACELREAEIASLRAKLEAAEKAQKFLDEHLVVNAQPITMLDGRPGMSWDGSWVLKKDDERIWRRLIDCAPDAGAERKGEKGGEG